jgi:isoquinoline 1-oxidoreductase beta subunit
MERRSFLKLSATAAGGLVIGICLPARRGALAAAAPFAPNAWLRIDADDRITFICPRNEMGQDVHTSLAMLVAEELEVTPAKLVIEQAPADPAYINTMVGGQLTGASTSVREAWLPLRKAAAATRMLVIAAAAATWKIDAATLRAADGKVSAADGRSATYGALAATAASMPVPSDASIVLKTPDKFRVIGSTTQPRLDTPAKVRGARIFGIDARQPGMVYAALAQCPVIGGTVTRFDDSKAKAIAGVRAVIDIGDGVAVVADHYWTARKARDVLTIEWNEGPGAAVSNATVAAALREGAKKPGAVALANGDVEAGLAQAARTLEAEYELPMLAHGTLEPMNCLALVTGEACDIWTSTQIPQAAHGFATARSGVPAQAVRIHPQFIGGGFGRRLEADFVGQAAAIAKAMPGVPVKLIWSREDDTTHDYYRPASLHRARGGLGKDGALVALDHLMVSQSITERAFPGVVKDGLDLFMTEGAENLTYAVPHLRSRVVIQDTGVRVGYWRSVSNALNAFAFESFIDELAEAAGKDPLDFRLALLAKQPRQHAVLARVADEAGWGKPRAKDSALGLASMECYGTHIALVAEVRREGGKLRCSRIWVALDPGIAVHPDQVHAQIESGIVTGLIGALHNRITITNGRVQQQSFDEVKLLRISQMPAIAITLMANGDAPGGIGETGTPLVAPALANAVARLTGTRARKLPFIDSGVVFV